MTIFTRGCDVEEYIHKLEHMVMVMAVDISNLLQTADTNICLYTAKEIIENYAHVISEPSVFEEMAHKEYGVPYLDRESILAYLVRTGVVVRDEYMK